ncbi:Panacea domain-containing protein [Oerskovia sp. NPDC060338]|uniref:Panacea domain-containing protein n=1 Tax=Oerskovia sp. NPDC060338 TaxID=3347100 RepID=UPI003655F09B
MISDLDVGAYIYAKMGWIDSWRLQKLTYYSQSWSLAWTGRPLFNDQIQAWSDGPVAPTLFRVNKYESLPMSTDLPGADVARLHPDAARTIDSVLAFYGEFNKASLIELTHNESPWHDAFNCGRNSEITRGAMLGFYSKLSAIGGAVPERPSLGETVVDINRFFTRAAFQQQRWAATLERLAQ